ncbi:hypothetical protein NDN08_005135 [Rhodosorus marinus]|uniref:Pentacotripeptide-repeat region of PRORP domain-containing protein n=1 Tax=Rhodosorus marinus TaxID=101924 RepID=A0AAV8V4Y7_9RHOD|nr:hypothetical protein NDN08_005135 [Rhodosorus marinus]
MGFVVQVVLERYDCSRLVVCEARRRKDDTGGWKYRRRRSTSSRIHKERRGYEDDPAARATDRIIREAVDGNNEKCRELILGLPQKLMRRTELVNQVIFGLGKHVSADEAKWALLAACEKGFQPNTRTFSALLGAFTRETRMNEVVTLFDSMTEFKVSPDISCFNALINCFAHGNDTRGAEEIFKELKGNKEIRPNAITYNIMLEMYSKRSCFEKVDALYLEMEAEGVHPDGITYNTYINALGRAGRIADAERVFKNCPSPDVFTFTTLMKTFSEFNRFEAAKSLFEDMKRAGIDPSLVTYSVMIDCLGKAGELVGAQMIMDEMTIRGLSPNIVCYTSLIRGYAQKGDLTGVLFLLKSMEESRLRPTERTFCEVIDAFTSSGKFDGAELMVEKMRDADMRLGIVAYNTLLKLYNSQKNVVKVRQIFEELVLNGNQPDEVSFNTYINALGEANDMTGAECAFLEMRARNVKVDVVTWNTILKIFAANGELESSLAVVQEMISHGVEPNIISYNTLLSTCAVHGTDPKPVLKQMRNRGLAPTEVTYATLMKICATRGDLQGCLNHYEKLLRDGIKPSEGTHSALASAFANHGSTDHLMSFMRENEKRLDIQTILDKATIYSARIGHFDQTEVCLSAFPEVTGKSPARSTFKSVLECFLKEGRVERAETVFYSLRPEEIDESIFNVMINAYGMQQNLERISALASSYSDYLKDVDHVVDMLCRANKTDAVERILCLYRKHHGAPNKAMSQSRKKMYQRLSKREDWKSRD